MPLRTSILLLCSALLGACAMPPAWTRGWQDLARGEPAPPALREEPPAGLAAPEGLRAESGQVRSVRLEWDPLLAGNVGGYAVERATAREGPFERIAAVSGRFATVYVDRGGSAAGEKDEPLALGDGTTVFYRVRPFASSGHLGSRASEAVAATTAPPPPAPAELRAYSLQPRKVPLSWRAAENPSVVGYVVERSPSSRGPFEEIARIEGRDETIYVDRGLGDLLVFYYRVASVNEAGAVGPPGEPVRAVTKPEPLPPYRVRAGEQHLGSNELVWEPNVEPDLAGYRVLRRREEADGPEIVVSLPPEQTTAVDAAVAADERVSYSVVALDRQGLESEPAAAVVVESVGYDLSAEARPDGVTLHWNPRADEGWERARILRSRLLRTRDLGVVEGGEYVDADVLPGERYRYTVVLERADATRAPPSSPVEVEIPES